jgi:hypothetical protein
MLKTYLKNNLTLFRGKNPFKYINKGPNKLNLVNKFRYKIHYNLL